MKIFEREGKTKEDVIEEVLKEIGSDRKEFIYNVDVVENGKSKFLVFGSKKVSVKVIVLEEFEKWIIDFLKEMLNYMNIDIKEIRIKESTESNVILELDSEDVGILIGRRGKTLESIQYLVNLIFNRNKEQKIKIILDINNYREKRLQSLQKLAKNSALFVKNTKHEAILNPMNPYERKIIHATLQDDRDVETESIGDGIYKQVKIKLK